MKNSLKRMLHYICVELKGIELLRPRDENTNTVKRIPFSLAGNPLSRMLAEKKFQSFGMSVYQVFQPGAVSLWSDTTKAAPKGFSSLITSNSS